MLCSSSFFEGAGTEPAPYFFVRLTLSLWQKWVRPPARPFSLGSDPESPTSVTGQGHTNTTKFTSIMGGAYRHVAIASGTEMPVFQGGSGTVVPVLCTAAFEGPAFFFKKETVATKVPTKIGTVDNIRNQLRRSGKVRTVPVS